MADQHWHPGTLLELSGSFWKTCTLHAAVKLDLFTAIDDRPEGGEAIAARIAADEDAAVRLLNALVALGLVEKDGETYRNTEASRKFLSKNSDAYLGHMIMHHHYLTESWARLDQSVSTGAPVRTSATVAGEPEREAFLMGMYTIASLAAPGIVDAVDLSGRRRLLDLGGGPGTFAGFFCRQHEDLTATVYDLPDSRPFAEKTIAKFGLEARVRFEAGNYVTDALTGDYDAVWMSHILHAERPETCEDIMGKVSGVVKKGGLIAIHEFILDDDGTGPVFPALFSLNMLLGTRGGRSYTEAELSVMLQNAGFHRVRRLDYTGPTQSGIIVAEK